MIDISLTDVSHRYGRVHAVNSLTMTVGGDTITAVVGPSGCGKTTLLKLVAGLVQPSQGAIAFGQVDVTWLPAERRNAVMVFQDHRLFPYLSVAGNVGFGLKMRRTDKRETRRRVVAILERVGLEGFEQRRPAELSGGQRQRVALARALILAPDVLLLDEPLANLDAHLREDMRDLIVEVHEDLELTTLIVTHDQEEAAVIADEIALVFDGYLDQYGPPRTFYERPASARAAQFFGARNLVAGTFDGSTVSTSLGSFTVTDANCRPGDVWLIIRPERIGVVEDDGMHQRLRGRVVSSRYIGTKIRATVVIDDTQLTIDASGDELADVGPGSRIALDIPASALWVVERATGVQEAAQDQETGRYPETRHSDAAATGQQ